MEVHMIGISCIVYEKGFWQLPCSKFVKHLYVWLPFELLLDYGIKYSMVKQRPGKLIILSLYV
jgi:hypothetical protein